MEWSWLASAEILACELIRCVPKAQAKTEELFNQIAKYGTLYEVYENDRPVSRFIYRSEKDFAWD
jgi:hypothetical protein